MEPKPLNVGFVGLGFGDYVAGTLATGPASSLFRLAAVCDLDAVRSREVAARRGVHGYTSLDELLADPAIAAVGLFTGPVGRAGLLRKIIRAGKDVMTTKPFELDPAAARSVLEEARSLGRTILLNSPGPAAPGYVQQIGRWQEEFALGRPISCRGEILISYREKADGRWFDDPAQCPAAPLFRLGIYVINDLVRLFGRVRSVQVLTSRLFTGRPTPDNAQLGLEFASGALGSILASFCVDNGQHYANSLVLNYESGTIFRNVFPVAYGAAEQSSRLHLAAVKTRGELIERNWTSPEMTGAYPWTELHEAMTSRQRIEMRIEEIVHGVEIIAAMARAERSGRTEIV